MHPSNARWILSKQKQSAFQNLWQTFTKGAICDFSPFEWKAQHVNQNKEALRSAPSPASYQKQQTPAERAGEMSRDGAMSMMLQACECRVNEPLTSELNGGLQFPERCYHAVFCKGTTICEQLQDNYCSRGLWLSGHFVENASRWLHLKKSTQWWCCIRTNLPGFWSLFKSVMSE